MKESVFEERYSSVHLTFTLLDNLKEGVSCVGGRWPRDQVLTETSPTMESCLFMYNDTVTLIILFTIVQ